jgi:hypothetical protein
LILTLSFTQTPKYFGSLSKGKGRNNLPFLAHDGIAPGQDGLSE